MCLWLGPTYPLVLIYKPELVEVSSFSIFPGLSNLLHFGCWVENRSAGMGVLNLVQASPLILPFASTCDFINDFRNDNFAVRGRPKL